MATPMQTWRKTVRSAMKRSKRYVQAGRVERAEECVGKVQKALHAAEWEWVRNSPVGQAFEFEVMAWMKSAREEVREKKLSLPKRGRKQQRQHRHKGKYERTRPKSQSPLHCKDDNQHKDLPNTLVAKMRQRQLPTVAETPTDTTDTDETADSGERGQADVAFRVYEGSEEEDDDEREQGSDTDLDHETDGIAEFTEDDSQMDHDDDVHEDDDCSSSSISTMSTPTARTSPSSSCSSLDGALDFVPLMATVMTKDWASPRVCTMLLSEEDESGSD